MKVRSQKEIAALPKKELVGLVQKYELELRYLRRLHFGSTSERLVPVPVPNNQNELGLFNEAEKLVEDDPPQWYEEDSVEEPVGTKSHTQSSRTAKQPKGKQKLSENLPRIDVTHDLPPEERACQCCGEPRRELGELVSEELVFVPAHYVVHRHIRRTYGECQCEDFVNSEQPGVLVAPLPRLIPGSLYSSGTIAGILTAKFIDGLPFYRQEEISKRHGCKIPRNTMAGLAIKTSQKLTPLLDLMAKDQKQSPVMRCDETSLQVLKEPGKTPESNSYAWVSYGYKDYRPIVIFRYFPGRGKEYAYELLHGFSGYSQTDGYGAYDDVIQKLGITHVGCWAHIRRDFIKAFDASDKKDSDAKYMIDEIRKLYELEQDLRIKLVDKDLTEEQFMDVRRRRALRIMSNIELWLDTKVNEVVPSSPLGRAIGYARGQIHKAKRYVEHILLTPDTNPIERSIRVYVIGRKGWLFADTQAGAHASMVLYSLVITAKANGLDPAEYLTTVLEKLPTAKTEEDLRALLPYTIAQEQKLVPGGYFYPLEEETCMVN